MSDTPAPPIVEPAFDAVSAPGDLSQVPDFSHEEEIDAYRRMLLIRRFEEKAGQLYGMGDIGGYCHLYIGQEAVVVGLRMAARDGDQTITAYRDHGHMLSCGACPREVMAELAGRSGGVSKGKGGSMHMFSAAGRFFGGHGIVGASVPLGAGLAFANRYRGDGGVCWCFLGDGAASQGQVFETFALARSLSLPMVFVIENNSAEAAMEPGDAPVRPTDLAGRGAPFGIPGERVDGMDVGAVRAAGRRAALVARSGAGPVVLEMLTCRYRGHSMADPARYASRGNGPDRRTRSDPIEQVAARILASAAASGDELKAIDREVRAVVADAAESARQSPEPDARELTTDVVA